MGRVSDSGWFSLVMHTQSIITWTPLVLVFRYCLKPQRANIKAAMSSCGLRLQVHSEHLPWAFCWSGQPATAPGPRHAGLGVPGRRGSDSLHATLGGAAPVMAGWSLVTVEPRCLHCRPPAPPTPPQGRAEEEEHRKLANDKYK